MDVLEQVVSMIATIMGKEKEEIKAEDNFKETLVMDALDSTELILGLEESFGIEISDDVADNLETVQDLVTFITEAINIESGDGE